MTTVEETPDSEADQASAWAWLPDETVTTPLAFCSGDSCDILFSTPRTLYAPVFWNISSLNRTRAPNSSLK